jgi:NTP pyrophosphatase (non-canonical NTP hydrolase)
MDINKLCKEAHENAVDKGFYDCPECKGNGKIEIIAVHTFEHGNETSHDFNKKEIIECTKCNGTGKTNKNIGELLMLCVSELSEALEAYRKNNFANLNKYNATSNYKHAFNYIKGSFEMEIADTFIRLFDLCEYLNIDIEKFIKIKIEYNKTRPYKHGKEY